jgi:galactonate dehydratase
VAIQEQSLGLHYHAGFAGLPAADLLDYLADRQALTVVDGAFRRLTGPGLGIRLDTQAIAAKAGDWFLPDADWRHPDGTYAEW